ncbi:Vacuolar protein sorting-associated protein VTA1 isoform 1 [Schistosoma japonicum]|uniref:Vacuolar protein sorting-associated protein VTA1 isoform 1 n=2 Tax=Schistosoma japonicum TaxID=6182 RepID=A0A4Z2DRR2_SCHJA|nr:Vacuolar protein sorting-associated protein vts1 [Schistosoma japonicum]KAH8864586.1 Vacuolar protein sorting-associated protein vts1 [Schistosoma japonicum]KAH8864588.1 Vacuolar protein sorting-associated protein vts1 [Schistosoma japonicum]KAH8864589.1 Vacuolar protein sorting-associated protein vts1 [Schistosoma japonicum]TNN19086.1 Vacuolar protein sorting-associated protein VTA1 isoform 1 [Schistosoma japonicum]
MNFSNVPKELVNLNVFLRCASDHSATNPIITYYCLLHAFQKGLSVTQKPPHVKAFLTSLMDKLEELKKNNSNCEEIKNETVGIPYVEQYALKLYSAAYQKDMNSDFGPATVKLFLSAATLLDVVSGAEEVGDDIEKARKYAKWKAVYISKCLKSGEVPISGPIPNTEAADSPSMLSLCIRTALFVLYTRSAWLFQ